MTIVGSGSSNANWHIDSLRGNGFEKSVSIPELLNECCVSRSIIFIKLEVQLVMTFATSLKIVNCLCLSALRTPVANSLLTRAFSFFGNLAIRIDIKLKTLEQEI